MGFLKKRTRERTQKRRMLEFNLPSPGLFACARSRTPETPATCLDKAALERQVTTGMSKEGTDRDKLQSLTSFAHLYKPSLKGVLLGPKLYPHSYIPESGFWGTPVKLSGSPSWQGVPKGRETIIQPYETVVGERQREVMLYN